MKDELFDDLVGSVKEAGAWLRGEQDLPAEQIHLNKPSFHYSSVLNVGRLNT